MDKGEEDECWEWTASRGTRGYGTYVIGTEKFTAHRLSCHFYKERLDGNKHALHHCDNPPCVNPNHLFAGTHEEHMQDAKEKGKIYFGEDNHQSKLCREEVVEIKKLIRDGELSYSEIGEKFGVGKGCIADIALERNWGHVSIEESEEFTQNGESGE